MTERSIDIQFREEREKCYKKFLNCFDWEIKALDDYLNKIHFSTDEDKINIQNALNNFISNLRCNVRYNLEVSLIDFIVDNQILYENKLETKDD